MSAKRPKSGQESLFTKLLGLECNKMVNVKNLLYMGNERKINYLFLFAPQLLRMIEANSSQLRSVL